eukprot:262108_1
MSQSTNNGGEKKKKKKKKKKEKKNANINRIDEEIEQYYEGNYLDSLVDGLQDYKIKMYEHYKKRGIPWPFKETNPETSILTTSITTIAHETSHKSETNTDKITTFGYIRQIQNKYNINVPYDVANICYMYYFSGLFCKLSEFKNIDQMEESIFADEETIQMVDYLTQIVLDPYTNNLYALKVSKKTECSKLIAERKMLEKLDNPFIVKLYKTFTDSCNIFTVFDGGFGTDLFSLLRANKCFNEKTARFYAACVIEAFVYLHSKNIIYRYLKPESIILEKNGYIKLKDFVLAKQVTNKTYTLCGTPDYLAPEIVQGQGHDKGVDWWTLGIFIYEMLASYPPFY